MIDELVVHLAIVFAAAVVIWYPGARVINYYLDKRMEQALGGGIPIDEPDGASDLAQDFFSNVEVGNGHR